MLNWAVVMVGVLLVSMCAIASADSMFLVTPEEANLPDAPAEAVQPGRSVGPDKGDEAGGFGPRIVVIRPEGQTVTGPLDIEVEFHPRADATVDLGTLEVKYVKLFSIDITDRVRPYASAEGIRVERVAFPKGRHTIRISIGDTGGALASRLVTVTVQ